MPDTKQNDTQREIDDWFATERDRLMVFIRSRISDPNNVVDIFQTAYLNARNGNFQPNTVLNAWIFTIARNCITDYHRKINHWRTLDTGPLNDQPDDRETDPQAALVQSDEYQHEIADLAHCLKSLSDDERSVVVGRMEGQEHGTISENNGWPTANRSEKTFFRAKTKLRICIQERQG